MGGFIRTIYCETKAAKDRSHRSPQGNDMLASVEPDVREASLNSALTIREDDNATYMGSV